MPVTLGACLRTDPSAQDNAPPAGLYLHVPFCRRKCGYCDFYSVTDLSLRGPFTDALAREMALRKSTDLVFDTVFFGGGTPSVLENTQLESILNTATETFPIGGDAEISMEINPGTVDRTRLKVFRSLGINRLTIGVQSFNDRNLRFLGRIHTAEQAAAAIEHASHEGFESIGLDLIYGIPRQGRADWLRDLKQAVSFNPAHLSCYLLTYESGTPLDHRRKRGAFRPVSETVSAAMFLDTIEFLTAAGYQHYEISNFARMDRGKPCISRHNWKYWSHHPYLGFGPAAHSFHGSRRWWNVRDLSRYIAFLRQGVLPVEATESLTPAQQMMERLMLGLRTAEGIALREFETEFEVNFRKKFRKCLDDLARDGYVDLSETQCALTPKGMMFHDSIVGRVVLEIQD